MILVDAGVLSYAVGEEHPLRAPCRTLLRAHGEGRIELATTAGVIEQFVHLRAARRSRDDAAAVGRYYASALTLLRVEAEELELALGLFVRVAGLAIADAVLAAVALNRRVEALVSPERTFSSVPELSWIDPGSAALTALIGG